MKQHITYIISLGGLLFMATFSKAQIKPAQVVNKTSLLQFLNQQPGLNYKANELELIPSAAASNLLESGLLQKATQKKYPFKLLIDVNRDGKKDLLVNYYINQYPITTAYISQPDQSFKPYSLRYASDNGVPYFLAPYNDSAFRLGRLNAMVSANQSIATSLSQALTWDTLRFVHDAWINTGKNIGSKEVDSIHWQMGSSFRNVPVGGPFWMGLHRNGTATWHSNYTERLEGSRIRYNMIQQGQLNTDTLQLIFTTAANMPLARWKAHYESYNNRWRDAPEESLTVYWHDGTSSIISARLNAWPPSLQFINQLLQSLMNQDHPMWQILLKTPIPSTKSGR